MPIGGRSGYISPAILGVPNSSERGGISEVGHSCAEWLHNPCRLGGPQLFKVGKEIRSAHWWAESLHNGPCRLGGLQLLRAGREMRSAHWWAEWLHNPGRLGVPNSSERGGKSELAHMWAQQLPKLCRLGGSGGAAREQNQKWPTCGQSGYLTPAVPRCLASGQNQKWPTCRNNGYLTLTVSGVPGPPKRQGLCSHCAHQWATSDIPPRSKELGTPKTAGAM